MTGDEPLEQKRRRVDRERIVRSLTFWLRPEFVLRVVNRFQKVAGFDRAIALASSALTATIPLAIIASAVSTHLGGTGTSLGIIGFFFLAVAVLSFTRAVQRLFEQTWELTPLSVRNTFNGLLWIAGLTAYLGIAGSLRAALGHSRLELTATLVDVPLSAVFLGWSGWILSAKRIPRDALLPFAVVGSVVLAVY